MGANMMPTMKKMGRTVFGVRMGLRAPVSRTRRFTRPSGASVHVLPCLQALLPEGRVCTAISIVCRRAPGRRCSLGGLLDFVFLAVSLLGSWLDIESVCPTCCVCDMVGDPRCSAAWAGE
jgi:hypothetical protein